MATVDLTAQRLRELLHYNPETGLFTRRVRRWKWQAEEIAGVVTASGYIAVGVDYKRYPGHRLAWLYVYGQWPESMLDHINCNKADNRIANLRAVDPLTNSENQRSARRDNKSSGLLGVSWHAGTGKWRAKIHCSGKSVHIGLFHDPASAHAAYVLKKRELHAGCTL